MKNSNWNISKNWISSENWKTIYKPYIRYQLNNSNYQGIKTSGYSWGEAPPNNTNISWENW